MEKTFRMTNRILDKTAVMRDVINDLSPQNCDTMKKFLVSYLSDIEELVVNKPRVDEIEKNKFILGGKRNYILLEGIGVTTKIEDLPLWIKTYHEIAIDNLALRNKHPIDKAYESFMSYACGNKYSSPNHLWNAFKLHWSNLSKEEKPIIELGKSVSPV